MIAAGVDVGSTTSKVVLLDGEKILAQVVIPSGALPQRSARDVFEKGCSEAGIEASSVKAIATTGYGRRLADFGDMIITEIKACAIGAGFTGAPGGRIRTVVDVGGQDTKVISIDAAGEVADFSMNEKCAAGTGRFLEMLAKKLELSYPDFVERALKSDTMIQMNSTCAVFAESEVVGLLARGIDKSDISAAIHNAIADRVCSMVRRVGEHQVVCFVGGGARNRALVKAVEEGLSGKVHVPEHPQTMIALGAAIEARNKAG
ncbi:MAG: acyl-CoA dehydratase activase [Planctomycetota bacterium]|jgi:predicted CoA-substrate-specific enzyme activase